MRTDSYGARLKRAMDRRPVSRRKLSFELADKTGNKQLSEYRTLGKYLADTELPSPDRARLLARQLAAPDLADVPSNGERRRGRQAELEERVVRLEEALDALGTDLAALASLPERVLALEQQAQPKTRRAAAKKTG